jgi:dTDP-4-amino-4,6-dideoxygalactose transaminase
MSSDRKTFHKDFTRQEAIPEMGIQRALDIMQSGKLHRYNVEPGEAGEAAWLEKEFAEYMGAKYCLACASCGSAMYLALKSIGVKHGDKVLCNAFTLAPVPGAIENSGALIELVEITEDYTIDFDDLEKKARDSKAKFFLMSHMRGHIANMDRVLEICEKYDLQLIEDCAHTMGASWDGRKSGSFGKIGCFSTQTYKHMNSGEGGLLVTDDEDIIAKAIIHSGSYMLYDKHVSRPPVEVFEKFKLITPNYSCRMDNLRAAILRPQLQELDRRCERWNERYRILEERLVAIPGIECPVRDPRERYVGSSIQFSLPGIEESKIRTFLQANEERGVHIKWFGHIEPVGFTSAYQSWKYFGSLPELPQSNRVLAKLCDMRIPLTFEREDCLRIAEIISETAEEIFS